MTSDNEAIQGIHIPIDGMPSDVESAKNIVEVRSEEIGDFFKRLTATGLPYTVEHYATTMLLYSLKGVDQLLYTALLDALAVAAVIDSIATSGEEDAEEVAYGFELMLAHVIEHRTQCSSFEEALLRTMRHFREGNLVTDDGQIQDNVAKMMDFVNARRAETNKEVYDLHSQLRDRLVVFDGVLDAQYGQ